MAWRRVDLHIHTPASVDYQQPGVTRLDILRRAEARGLDIIAFTDHNSVRGYADMWREIEDLELLEYLRRIEPAEAERLAEYRRLLDRILVLPGFELTATFGFHVLAIFPEGTTVRLMEHLLLLLGVPEEKFGSGEVGATTDVLRAYEVLADHGALVIGAHVNSAHGIAMRGLGFGGQTKIAYTQDPNLHALEVTDLLVPANRRSTARFFNGTKAEYPRRMHCIQGSDAHRLGRGPEREGSPGVGDRATEMLLPEISFAALKALFLSDDFSRTRPYVPEDSLDAIRAARAAGNSPTQIFHESLSTKRTGLTPVLRDIVALANSDGGTIYVGASPHDRRPIVGLPDAKAAAAELEHELAAQVTPPPPIETEVRVSGAKQVLVVRVPAGAERPYALAPGTILVREDAESVPASRDQIVAMVRGAAPPPAPAAPPIPEAPPAPAEPVTGPSTNGRARRPARAERRTPPAEPEPARAPSAPPEPPAPADDDASAVDEPRTAPAGQRLEEYEEPAPPDPVAPRTGLEVLDRYESGDVTYYTLRDLRNRRYVFNVPADTGHRLWRRAIQEHEQGAIDPLAVRWHGDYGYVRTVRLRGDKPRHTLVYRGPGEWRVFFGVSDDGLAEPWQQAVAAARAGLAAG